MITDTNVVHARVRDTCQGYLAAAHQLRASCTAGAEQAAQALARKVFNGADAQVERVGHDKQYEIWRLTRC